MWSENLAYALTQLAHNFGAAAVVGGAVFVLWPAARLANAREFAWLILLAWSTQIATGIVFGAISLYHYGHTPDLTLIARAALAIKVIAAAGGLLLAAHFLRRGEGWTSVRVARTFRALAALGALALGAAAFLRWFA